jgi:hypothetical protein
MTQDNSTQNDENSSAVSQRIEEQQRQIDSIVVNLERMLNFIQAQKSSETVDVNNSSALTQVSLHDLNAIGNNLAFLRDRVEAIESGLVKMKATIEQSSQSSANTLSSINESLKSVHIEHIKLQESLTIIKNSPVFHKKGFIDLFDLKTIVALGVGMGAIAILASFTSASIIML